MSSAVTSCAPGGQFGAGPLGAGLPDLVGAAGGLLAQDVGQPRVGDDVVAAALAGVVQQRHRVRDRPLHQRGGRRLDVAGVLGERGRDGGADQVGGRVGGLQPAADGHDLHPARLRPCRPPCRARTVLRGAGRVGSAGSGCCRSAAVWARRCRSRRGPGAAGIRRPGGGPAARTARTAGARAGLRRRPVSVRSAAGRSVSGASSTAASACACCPRRAGRPRRRTAWCGRPRGSTRTSPGLRRSGPVRTPSHRPSTD